MSKLEVLSPTNGTLITSNEISDETFSKNMMGQGFSVIPNDKVMFANFRCNNFNLWQCIFN